jgi:hypothetical protein
LPRIYPIRQEEINQRIERIQQVIDNEKGENLLFDLIKNLFFFLFVEIYFDCIEQLEDDHDPKYQPWISEICLSVHRKYKTSFY